jgi:hypothetical protein
MHKFALLNATRAASLAAAGKVVFFLIYFFLYQSSILTPSVLERFPRRTCRRAFVCNCESWFVLLSCYCKITQLNNCPCALPIVPTLTRHISCIGGVLHLGDSDSWFFRWQQCRRNRPRSQYVYLPF